MGSVNLFIISIYEIHFKYFGRVYNGYVTDNGEPLCGHWKSNRRAINAFNCWTIMTLSKIYVYKISWQNSVDSLYTNEKWTKKIIRETTPFIMVSNNIKYLEVSLPNQVIDMYLNDKTIKSLKKEI